MLPLISGGTSAGDNQPSYYQASSRNFNLLPCLAPRVPLATRMTGAALTDKKRATQTQTQQQQHLAAVQGMA